MAEPPVTFAGLLRRLRDGAGLTQEELAEAAQLSVRSVSDLERGVNQTARKETARLLADALRLTGSVREEFEAIARGRPVPVAARTSEPSDSARSARTLPRDIGSFTGREHELSALVAAASNSGGVVGIHVIGGMAGVGKTAFAVHAAHLLAGHFPDGQLFLPLHGHTPGRTPAEPGDALASLLFMTGVPATQIPANAVARAALWRDRLVGKRLLLVLDDATGSEQVRALLPSDSGCLVLVTSRRHLSALEDAELISLDTLRPGEAARLLGRVAGRPGLSPEDPAVEEIIRLCGYLPLAISLVARQLHHHPAWPLSEFAADFTEARDRLHLMAAEDVSVAAAFDLSYDDLTPDQQRIFRRIGLHPGTDIDAFAAAALDEISLSAARRTLEALYDQNLLTEPAYGRFRMHDLIRQHARALAVGIDPATDREQATTRLLDYYQQACVNANALIARQARRAPAAGSPAAILPALGGRERALDWARAERANLLACLDQATAAHQHARVIAFTHGVAELLRHDGPWVEAIARCTTALHAAQHLGDRFGKADLLNYLGYIRLLMGDYPGAARDLGEALDIYRDSGDKLGQANALTNLVDVLGPTGDYQGAARNLEEALSIYRDIGDRHGQAWALNGLGRVRRMTWDYPGATQALEESLALCRDMGDRSGQAWALHSLGDIQRATGDHPGAMQNLEKALNIYQDLGDRLGQANTHDVMGRVSRTISDYPGAAQSIGEALEIYREIGNRLGQANALITLGELRRMTGDYPGATQAIEESLAICLDSGNVHGQANALLILGSIRRGNGDYPGAIQAIGDALGIFRELGSHGGAAEALNETGMLHMARGDLRQARACHAEALDLARQIGTSWDEAHALAGLGRCAQAAGDTAEAGDRLRQALGVFRRIGAAEADEVAAELDALTESGHVSR